MNAYPLRSVSVLDEWRRRDDPPEHVWRTVFWWAGELIVAPWQAPSAHIDVMSNLPNYEVRYAVGSETAGVGLWYMHYFVGGEDNPWPEMEWCDLLWVES